jgi:transposase
MRCCDRLRIGCRWRHGQQLTRLGDILGAIAVGGQAVMPDAMEPFGQYVQEKAPDEPGWQRYALRDDPWIRIKDFLPGREGDVGGTATDDRLFVDAIICRDRTGIPWRDLPERHGDWKATRKRFRRWCERGVFARIPRALALDAEAEYMPSSVT